MVERAKSVRGKGSLTPRRDVVNAEAEEWSQGRKAVERVQAMVPKNAARVTAGDPLMSQGGWLAESATNVLDVKKTIVLPVKGGGMSRNPNHVVLVAVQEKSMGREDACRARGQGGPPRWQTVLHAREMVSNCVTNAMVKDSRPRARVSRL